MKNLTFKINQLLNFCSYYQFSSVYCQNLRNKYYAWKNVKPFNSSRPSVLIYCPHPIIKIHFCISLPQNVKWEQGGISRLIFATHNTLIIWSIIFSLWHLNIVRKYLRFISFIEELLTTDVYASHADILFNYCSYFTIRFEV